MTKEFEQFRTIVDNCRRVVLSTHINPDADGIGSELALGTYLKGIGKQVAILNHSKTPENLLFLDPLREVLHFNAAKHSSIVKDAELICVIDTNHLDRLADLKPLVTESKSRKICIDHHLEPGAFADLYILDEESTATGEIIFKLITYLDPNAVTREVASHLYAAIMTDTGSFRYPKTDAEMHRIIADLIDYGADPTEIYQSLYEQGPAGRVQLLGMALAGLRLAHQDKVAYMILTRTMFKETDTTEADADAFVPYTLTIQGVQIGLLFTELPNDVIKVSFRAKGDIWVNKLAQQFGGNGHQHAAGVRIHNADLDDVIRQVLAKAEDYIH